MYLCTGCENVAVDKDVERPLVHNDDGEDNKVKSNEQLNKTKRLESMCDTKDILPMGTRILQPK